MRHKLTLACPTFIPIGPKKWRRGGRWWRTTRTMPSWRELCVWGHVSFSTISGTADVKVVWKSFTVLSSSLTPTVKIPLDRVQDAWWKSGGPFQIKRLAEHYGVFADLFNMAYFLPQVPLHICYSQDSAALVNYGNRLTPTQVRLRSRTFIFLSFNLYRVCVYSIQIYMFLVLRQHRPPRSASKQRRVLFGPCCSPVPVSFPIMHCINSTQNVHIY